MLALGVAAASAHVHVDADDTAANGYTHLTFSVPNESPTAKTNKLEVTLPTSTPFTSVSVKPIDGWTAQVLTTELPKPVTINGTTVTKAPTSVVWTADKAHEIGQNQYQTFSLSVGRLPAAGTAVTLPAAQTYTDGHVANWNEKTVAGQEEPQHPAPAFTTTADGTATTDPTTAAAAAPDAKPAADNATGVWGIILGAVGVLLGGTALGLVLARRRNTAA